MANERKLSRKENVDITAKDSTEIKDLNEYLKELPEHKRKIVLDIFAMENKSFSGPLPPPELFKLYEDALPGASERILSMAERQQAHRISTENTIVKDNFGLGKRGQIIGALLAFSCLASATALGLFGHVWLAGLLGGGTMIEILVVYVLNREPSRKEK